MRTVSRVRIAHIGGTSNQKLHFVVVLVYDFLNDFKYQSDAFLSCDSAHKREKWDGII